jgi:hypothetical protein
LYGALSQKAKTAVSRTPFFCDHEPSVTQFSDAGYKHMFFSEQEDGAIVWPMCRAYYCKYEACEGGRPAGLFILSDVFTRQYDFQFKALRR